MFSKSLKTMIPAALALCLATLSLGASIEARDANTLERRHTGPYTWCGFQSEYEAGKVVGGGFDLVWKSHKYSVKPNGGLKSVTYEPPVVIGNSLKNGNFYLDGGNWQVALALHVADDGDIEGVAIAAMTVDNISPPNAPSFGFQCSSDTDQKNKVTIPAMMRLARSGRLLMACIAQAIAATRGAQVGGIARLTKRTDWLTNRHCTLAAALSNTPVVAHLDFELNWDPQQRKFFQIWVYTDNLGTVTPFLDTGKQVSNARTTNFRAKRKGHWLWDFSIIYYAEEGADDTSLYFSMAETTTSIYGGTVTTSPAAGYNFGGTCKDDVGNDIPIGLPAQKLDAGYLAMYTGNQMHLRYNKQLTCHN
ncbi:uncharacterized protein L969DRAFT_95165 [Mixia osmundae IAM 14324]|uniref:Uncharacterized protein n=1 Tax=Mixia osmundae (strain CBS 9802 / IAM 14324 / JCM 22182 / KY 12970) TaxID=764103 RepID=G7E6Z7_MIXOS|nr:uncharacterized protein L969DRAFT_95165 [Mixia osmundae IAM 14324]KEI39010.1 hypothetical protein L969DRAFT_95165 [Mixia osmundae IAM 14324]GAA98607.1 hypothetical protein E5Q_05294 [Mixia osmundae IAM 14324]